MDLKDLWKNTEEYKNKEVEIHGWIRNHRRQKDFGFIDFSDGTCFKHIQIVYDTNLSNFETISHSRKCFKCKRSSCSLWRKTRSRSKSIRDYYSRFLSRRLSHTAQKTHQRILTRTSLFKTKNQSFPSGISCT